MLPSIVRYTNLDNKINNQNKINESKKKNQVEIGVDILPVASNE